MPDLTQELLIVISFGVISIFMYFYLFFRLLKRYFTTKYPSTILMILFSLLLIVFSEIMALIAVFVPEVTTILAKYFIQTESEIYLILQLLHLISFILSLFFILLFSEIFEYDTILTQQQMFITVITTLTLTLILIGNYRVEWVSSLLLYENHLDSLTELVIVFFPLIVGLFTLLNLYNGFKDSWITQKRQMNLMIIATIIITILPLLIRFIILIGEIHQSIGINLLLRAPITVGFLIYYFSFENKEYFSLYSRRKADKLIVTDLNGIPLFVYDFKDKTDNINETLFAGAIVAITMLMAESLKSPAPIAEVLMKNKYRMMLESKSSFLTLIMTPKGDNYLRESLKTFAVSFEQKFSSIINSGNVVDLNLFAKSGITILFKNFGIPFRYKDTISARIPKEENLT